MKKSFLLVFLMAFLPYVGWSQANPGGNANLDEADITFTYARYGGGAPTAQVIYQGQVLEQTNADPENLNPNGSYDWDGKYYTDEDCTQEFEGEKLQVTGTAEIPHYWVKFTGTVGTVYEGSEAIRFFDVMPRTLWIKALGEVDLDYDFGEVIDNALTAGDIEFVPADELADPLNEGFAEGEDIEDLDVDEDNLSFSWDNGANTLDAGEYGLTINGISSDNYIIKVVDDLVLKIKAFDLAAAYEAGKITIELVEGQDLTYTSEEIEPQFTVVYDPDGDGEAPAVTLVQGTHFAVVNNDGEGDGDDFVPDPIVNAGEYEARIVGINNYTGEIAEGTDFEVLPAPLMVYVSNLTKVYDGTEDIYGGTVEDKTPATIAYSGLLGDDATTVNPFGPAAFTVAYNAEGNHVNVTEEGYAIKPVRNNPNEAFNNYTLGEGNVNLLATGKLFVTPLAITITADDMQKQIDGDDPELTFTIEGAPEENVEAIGAAYEASREEGEAIGTYVITVAQKEELEDEVLTLLANFEIELVTGTFTITGDAGLYVYPKAVTVEYGDETPETFEIVAVTGSGTEVELSSTNTVSFKDGADDHSAIGAYVLQIDGNVTADGYEADAIHKLEGQYIVTKKTVKITLPTQVLEVEDDEDDLDLEKVLAVLEDEKVDAEDELPEFALAFNIGEAEGQIPDADVWEDALGEDADGKKYAKGYMIADDAENEKYIIKVAYGKLVVGAAEGLEFTSEDQDWQDIQDYDGEEVDVLWSPAREQGIASYDGLWKAGEWNTAILPFEITVGQLSAAFGYAIVNVVDEENSTVGNVAFKLEMGTIPANTPFAIKTAGDIDAEEFIDLEGVTIDKPETSKVEQEIGDLGYKFVGVYEEVTLDKTTPNMHFLVNGGWKHIGTSSSNTYKIIPFNCYVDQTPAAAARGLDLTFTFQELDGSVTAIKAIDADAVNANRSVDATGWYTIGGVKLNAAPTQKGVYINNGKKVVIK